MTTFGPIQEAPEQFGPDFTSTPDHPPADVPTPEKKSTRASRKNDEGIFGLGKNSPARSSVRQLNEDDRIKLVRIYERVAGFIRLVHPRLGNTMESQAEECADSWAALAAVNVKVRSKILAIVEGGELFDVLVAHSPLLIAVLPEEYVLRFMNQVTTAFGEFLHKPQPEEEETFEPQYVGGGAAR